MKTILFKNDTHKECGKCHLLKEFSDFNKRGGSDSLLKSSCKICQYSRSKAYRTDNYEKIRQIEKTSSEKYKDKRKAYYLKNREKLLVRFKENYEKNKVARRSSRRDYMRMRTSTDPEFKLKKLLRVRLHHCLQKKTWNKSNKFSHYIGCGLPELKNHLENKFKEGMNWSNHTTKGWHIDHIIPLDSAKTEEELYKLCHYTNLQPLWWNENISKGNKIWPI